MNEDINHTPANQKTLLPLERDSKLQERFSTITKNVGWRAEANRLLNNNDLSDIYRNEFHIAWTVQGHRIREQLGNTHQLVRMLRHVLPCYDGVGLTLYRGENIDRLEKGDVGLCWTPNITTATMFARGLNAVCKGGKLIEINCPREWVIAGPSSHSVYLDENEFTIDPSLISNFSVIEEYPPLS
jgi:hypothetical protein